MTQDTPASNGVNRPANGHANGGNGNGHTNGALHNNVVLITGAAGWLGGELVKELLVDPKTPNAKLILADIVEPTAPSKDSCICIKADLTNPAEVKALFQTSFGVPDTIYCFHGIMSRGAEDNFDLGLKVNIDSIRLMLEAARHSGSAEPIKFIFTSSLAVYGGALPEIVLPETIATPEGSYGCGKLGAELLINEYTRRGFVDGRIMRLPTIVVRPGVPSAATSAFISGIIREPLQGLKATCPVGDSLESPMLELAAWVASPEITIKNFVVAKHIHAEAFKPYTRTVCLPGFTVTVREELEALRRVAGEKALKLVEFKDDATNRRVVSSWPARFDNTYALSLGFTVDEGDGLPRPVLCEFLVLVDHTLRKQLKTCEHVHARSLKKIQFLGIGPVSLPALADISRQEAALATAAAVAVSFAIWSLSTPRTNGKTGKPLPRPPALPIVGNMHLMKQGPLQCLQYWGEKLGPIFRFDIGTEHWVVVNDSDIAYELCSKRGALYNSRPASSHFSRIQSADFKQFAMTPYGEEYQEYIDREATHLVDNVRKTHGEAVDPVPLIQLFTYNVIAKVLVDERHDHPFDPWVVEEMELVDKFFKYASLTAHPARIFPILRILPQSWVGVKEEDVVALTKRRFSRFDAMLDKLRKRLDTGEDVKCFCKDLLEKESNGELDHEEVLTFISVMILAGNDTTASTIAWWIAEMANHPDIQQSVHAEIKANIGIGELPPFKNAADMPYLNATLRETMRLHPAGPLAVPHSVMEDDIFEGYHIPKDSTVMFNVYTMNRDPRRYKDPDTFKPERYLDVRQPSSSLVNGKPEDRDHMSFGFGRRVCAGMHLAELELLVVTSAILSSFSIVTDSPIDTEDFDFAFTLSPLPFKVRFLPRA
ncbi:hypothetical protein BZG36_02664 [Bifiguratus adelaidae]|uniref:NAD-dependent epimerase/dehydratase domain-containing protein n=1 Tax=Bifiguratus adelaidae TaxID=1938954 RepID=A0A261Y1J1_9FUNG|nr:hypothetical protein BZG36_02664 [Bifiguratus adelaidae]